jgi:SAM-dependent methyltransferase
MRPEPGNVAAEAVKNQYERYPFPPLAIGALADLKPCQADYAFAYHYQRPNTGPLLTAPRILDAGCGTGFSTLKLAELNPEAEISAVELSQSALRIAQKRLQAAGLEHRVRFYQGDLQNAALVQRLTQNQQYFYDYLHCSGVIHHIPRASLALKHLRQCLKPSALAYFMVYGEQARHEISQIQEMVYLLWQNHEDWQEGLLRCRSFLAELPITHPLKQFHLKALHRASYLLGEEVTHSDAFWVDTYLQRCEHLWDVNSWQSLLKEAGFQPGRWLDESTWQLAHYTPQCAQDFHLPAAAELKLVERLRPAHHFAHFATVIEASETKGTELANKETAPTVFQAAQEVLYPFTCITPQAHDKAWGIENQVGQRIVLDRSEWTLWQRINGRENCKQILKHHLQDFPEADKNKLKESLKRWVNHYCVGWLLRGPAAVDG